MLIVLLGKDTFTVKISPLHPKDHVRIHVPPPLDRDDGTFLVRYRLYGTSVKGLSIQVLHRSAPVAKSPYLLQGEACLVLGAFLIKGAVGDRSGMV